jgi:uncharacterized protein YjlB
MKTLRRLYFEKASDVPNSSLPVILVRSALPPNTSAKEWGFREAFKRNGWTGLWTDTIYDYTHFHSNAHEVLAIAEGKVSLRLGGAEGSLVRLRADDMIVIPAGVGHRRVGPDEGLKVIGAYPPGQSHFDMKRQARAIPKVTLPRADAFYGSDGLLIRCWTE